nr:hypothetical protein [Tanacetum cinerariifolium]
MAKEQIHLGIFVIGHVDSGKSTTTGHLNEKQMVDICPTCHVWPRLCYFGYELELGCIDEKSKETKALRRKERNAENAPIRAYLRARKEAEKREWKSLIISYEGASGDFTGCTGQTEPLRMKGKLILLVKASNLRIRTVVYDYMVIYVAA